MFMTCHGKPESTRRGTASHHLSGDVDRELMSSAGKQPARVQARSVATYWAVRHLDLTATEVGKELGLSKSGVCRAVERGRRLTKEQGWRLEA